ncbi:MAG: glycosyltransferase family 2 protein [Planctomycetales bacterium]
MDEDVWIIVPAYNEARVLSEPLDALCRHYQNVIVVDDGSTDGTLVIAEQFPVFRMRHLINCGQGAAIRTGLDFALKKGAQVLVTFDADGQHMVHDIKALINPILDGEVDVTLGSRFLGDTEGMPRARWLLLKAGVLFTRLFSRINVTDTHNGMRAFSRNAADAIPVTEDGMAHASEILDEIYRLKLKFREVPVRIRYSEETLSKGQSGWNSIKIATQFLLGRIFR